MKITLDGGGRARHGAVAVKRFSLKKEKKLGDFLPERARAQEMTGQSFITQKRPE